MIEQIIHGSIGGLAVAITGAGKSKKKFQWSKFGSSIVVATIVGGLAASQGIDYGLLANSGLAAGIAVIVENAGKILKRKAYPHFYKFMALEDYN